MKNNGKKIRNSIVLAILIIVASTSVAVFGSAESDPLVTLSYINKTVIPKITEDVKNAVLAVLDEKLANISVPTEPETPSEPVEPEVPAEPETPSKSEVPQVPAVTEEDLASFRYNVICLTKGQKLFASGENTESTEIILRSGQVVCISPFGDQGIADLTASKELYNGDSLVKNNYCLIPRGGDGRGISAVSSDAYILVRGEYEIVQE